MSKLKFSYNLLSRRLPYNNNSKIFNYDGFVEDQFNDYNLIKERL